MKRDVRQLRTRGGLLLGAAIFMILFFMAVDGKAADPGADYPNRPIEFVTHSRPGSSGDVLGRVISEIIQREKILSQPVIVVNKPSSGGGVAFNYVFERKGNPYVVLNVSGTFLTTPLTEKLPYTSMSFTPIANTLVDGDVLVVKSDSPFKTANDIVAEAKKKPKELIQGGGSFSSAHSLMGLNIQKLKGVQWNFISFAGGGTEALLAVLAGNVHFAFGTPTQVLDHVRAGKLRVLLTATPGRYQEFKDAPTMKEAGFGEPILAYRGIVGPPNMPDYAVKKLAVAFKKLMDSDRYKKFYEEAMMQPFWLSLNEYGKFLEEESKRWKGYLDGLGLSRK